MLARANAARSAYTVENTISPLLPHGQAHADVVAKKAWDERADAGAQACRRRRDI